VNAPRGRKLYEHGLLVAYRTTPELGQPAEVWALVDAFRDDPRMVAMFEDARRFLELHEAPCLPRLVDDGDREFLVTAPPWVGLDTIVARGAELGGVALDLVIAYMHALARAMATLPALIMLRTFDPMSLAITTGGAPRLLDFTLAQYERRRVTTEPGILKGVPAYLSPELARGGRFTTRSDVFSLALVARELVTGRRVFTGTPIEILRALQSAALPDLRDECDDLPMDFVLVLERMLQRDAVRRPSWAEIAEALAPMVAWTPERVFDEVNRLAPTETEAAIVYGF